MFACIQMHIHSCWNWNESTTTDLWKILDRIQWMINHLALERKRKITKNCIFSFCIRFLPCLDSFQVSTPSTSPVQPSSPLPFDHLSLKNYSSVRIFLGLLACFRTFDQSASKRMKKSFFLCSWPYLEVEVNRSDEEIIPHP